MTTEWKNLSNSLIDLFFLSLELEEESNANCQSSNQSGANQPVTTGEKASLNGDVKGERNFRVFLLRKGVGF